MRRLVFLMLLVVATWNRGLAQEVFQELDCAALLSGAENEFAAGRFYGLPAMLKDCIDRNQFSNEEEVRVYMLLTQVYLLTDEPVLAEESYLKLLAADPEYVATEEKDPIDVVYLSKKFTTTPIFTPHLKAGVNLTTETTIFELTTISTPDTVVKIYQPLTGFTLGAGIDWNINDNLGIGGEVLVAYKSFRETYEKIWEEDIRIVTEKQFWVDVPFYLRYGYHRGKLRPYGYAGFAVNVLVHDELQLESIDVEGTFKETTDGPDLNVLYKRHILSGSVLIGGGLKYKWGKNFFMLDVRLMAGLANIVNEERNHYADKDSFELGPDLTEYGGLDNILRVNNYSLSLGFVRPLYDPRRHESFKSKHPSRKKSTE